MNISSLRVEDGRLMWADGGEGYPIPSRVAFLRVRWYPAAKCVAFLGKRIARRKNCSEKESKVDLGTSSEGLQGMVPGDIP
jgi:hypothetical protein